MNISDLEKVAKLMGYEVVQVNQDSVTVKMTIEKKQYAKAMAIAGLHSGNTYTVLFNPRTYKADLSDVIDELGIDVRWASTCVSAGKHLLACGYHPECSIGHTEFLSAHPTKFAARAEAVISVCVQMYDAKYGKDGE